MTLARVMKIVVALEKEMTARGGQLRTMWKLRRALDLEFGVEVVRAAEVVELHGAAK